MRNRARVVSRDFLVTAIWQGPAVSDWAISGTVKSVRLALGDTGRVRNYIRTVHGTGYGFFAEARDGNPGSRALATPVCLVRVFQAPDRTAGLGYLADGLAEDLIKGLSRAWRLMVLSCNTERALGTELPPPDLAVSSIVEGTVRPAETKTQITVTVLDEDGQKQHRAEDFYLTAKSLRVAYDMTAELLAAL